MRSRAPKNIQIPLKKRVAKVFSFETFRKTKRSNNKHQKKQTKQKNRRNATQIMKFYDKKGEEIDTPLSEIFNEAWMTRVLIPVINKSSSISIRLIDWLCTNYSKEKSISYLWVDKERGMSRIFSVHTEYKQTLKSKSRRLFDAFRRGERMYFKVDNEKYETTMGQLLFAVVTATMYYPI